MSEKNTSEEKVEEEITEEVKEEIEGEAAEEAEVTKEVKEKKKASKSAKSAKAMKAAKPKKPFNKRKFKHGVISAAFTILFVAAVVVLNVIIGIISERVNTSADLTTVGLYSLDDSTEDFLEMLESDVSVTVLNSEKTFESQDSSYKQVNEILQKMRMASEHFALEYLDIDQNPNYTAKFKGETLNENYIVFESGKTGRHKIISPSDYFNYNQTYLQYYGAYVPESSNVEQEAISAMMYVTSDKVYRVAFAEGYGEGDSSTLQSLFSKNGYDVEKLPLNTTSEIDDGIDYVVLFAPTMDYDKEQLAKLDKFLDNGGKFGKNVLYFASTQQPKTPNIDEFLKDWGLETGFEVVGQTDSSYLISSETPFVHFQQLCDTEYTKNVYGGKLYTYGMYLRPVNIIDSGADCTVLLKSYDKAFLYPMDREDAEKFELEKAENGVFNAAVISRKTSENGEKSGVCAFGSELLASTLSMSYSNSNNAEFFVGILDSTSGREQGVTIKAKNLLPATFEVNVKTANTLSVVLCVVIPIAVIVLGIVIWVRRRHR